MLGPRIRPVALLVLLVLSASVVSAQCISDATVAADRPLTVSLCAADDTLSAQALVDTQVILDGPVSASGVDATSGKSLFPLPSFTLTAGVHTVRALVRNSAGASPLALVATLTATASAPVPDPTPVPTPTPTPSCVPVLTPSGNLEAPAVGITASIAITVAAGCAWQAASGASYIHVTPASGTGPGSVIYAVDANTAEAREQDIGFGGATFHVHQLAGAATPVPTPTPTCTDGQVIFQVGAVLWQPNVKVQGLVSSTAIYQQMIAAHWVYLQALKVKGNVYNLQFRCGV